MSKIRKILTLAACAVLLVCVTVAGTVAYLQYKTEAVVNTFTVGDILITLDESDVDDSTENKDRDTANTYHLLPGQTYVKDPIVHIDGDSESCYVRVIVTVDNIEDVKNAFPELVENGIFKLDAMVTGWKNETWQFVAVNEENGAAKYEFRYVGSKSNNGVVTVTADTDLEAVFTNVVIPNDATNDDLSALVGSDGKVVISVEAHAMQATGFADATAAWNAFVK